MSSNQEERTNDLDSVRQAVDGAYVEARGTTNPIRVYVAVSWVLARAILLGLYAVANAIRDSKSKE